MKKIALILVLLLAIGVFADWSVQADISDNRIGLDDNLTLTISVTGDKLEGLQQPKFPESDDWAFMGVNKSTSSSFEFVGGRMTQSQTVTYQMVLSPRKKGSLTIPKLAITANKDTRWTPTFQVEVVEGSVYGGRQQPGTPRPSQPAQPVPTPQTADIKDNLFISASADKNEAFIGEQVTVTFTLYTQYTLGQISLSKDAVFQDFWSTQTYTPKTIQYERKTVRGKDYNAFVVAKYALFGLSAGEKTITPMEIQCQVLTRRDFWGFFASGEQVKLTGNPLKIKVKPLPSGAPDGFEGLVGDFSASAVIVPEQPKSNEAFSYKITVSGTGNIQNLKTPKLQFPPNFEVYDTQEKGTTGAESGRMGGSKVFEYVIIPRAQGEFDLPIFNLVYFNPKTGRYETRPTKPIRINIGEGRAVYTTGTQVITQGRVVQLGEDIKFIAPDCAKLRKGNLDTGTKIFLLLPIEFLFLIIALIIRQRRARLEQDVGFARFTRAYKRASQSLKKASSEIADTGNFARHVQVAILHYLADRLGLPQEGIIFSEIRDRLSEKRIDDETLDKVEELLEKLNFLRFAPGDKEATSKELLNSAQEIIKKIDRIFK